MPPKQYDFSDFDEPVITSNQDKPNYDFSDFDTEDIKGVDNRIEPVESGLVPTVEQFITPASGYAAGAGIQKAISKTGELAEKGLEKIAEVGGTSPEQLKLIKQNFAEFKATDPIEEMNKLLSTARGTNLEVNRLYGEAEKLLADKKITPDEFKSIVEKAVLEKNKYNQPTFAKPISQSELVKTVDPALKEAESIIKSKQEKLLDEYSKLKAQQAIDRAKDAYGGVGLDPKTSEQIFETTRQDVLKDPKLFGFEGLSNEEISKIISEQQQKQISKKTTKLADTFPSLKGTDIIPSEEKAFQKILGLPSSADVTGPELQEFIRKAREKAFLEDGNLSDKPSAAFGTEARKKISEISPEAGKLMEAENIEIKKLDALEKAGYIKKEGSGIKTVVEMTDPQRNKLVKDLATAYDKANPTDVVESLEVLKNYLSPEEFKKLQLAGIKLAEKRGGGIDYINANKINAILQSITKRSVARGIATIAESFPKTTSAIKTGVKALGPLAGVAGAAAGGYFGYQEAKEEGLPDIAAYPYAAFEAVNPLPVSPIQAKKALETSARGRAENIAENYKMTPEELEKSKQRTDVIKEMLPSWMKKEDTKFKSSKTEDISDLLNKMSSMDDKAAVEYSRVLQQLVDAPESQKEAMLFSLNQQPAFKEIIRRIKNNE